ncbi:hypothetical protein JY651_17095 [Pyxidicoccus parkwayensis]|uniref:Lipoprotein n=1 Tax=Pyxidicoccus parkwayensis TaxID=2813578 RepID=A0ABX7P7S3_9BACT|nr:hypothetical protein [Pyxidicoccus parkwaysis]QSQ26539.1 hypothetical protein JY651_17095 [Pyxidicoccus parkwaysis]
MSKRWSGVAATVVAALALLACGGTVEAPEALGTQSSRVESYYPCGDGICDGNEPVTCPMDCGGVDPEVCGNGYCGAGEDPYRCPQDCGYPPSCGDGVCNGSETSATCPSDCVGGGGPSCTAPSGKPGKSRDGIVFYYPCGDGICDGNEPVTCPMDCC